MTKLTKCQRAVLEAAATRDIDFYDASHAGGNGKTLHALSQRGYLVSNRIAGGQLWKLTDAGRAALDSSNG